MAELAGTSLFNDANLVAYYKLEDTADSKGANTLTNTGTTPFNAAKFNNGADFGESNTTKLLGRAGGLGVANNVDLSISLWLKLKTEIGSGYYTFLQLDDTVGGSYFSLSYNFNAGTRRLEVDANGPNTTYNITLGTSLFYHIVITRNISGNQLKIYVDNVLVATGTVTSSTGANNRFRIGAHPNPTNYSSAIIDDVGVFTKVLSVAEVNTLFKEAAGGAFLFSLI